MVTMLHSVHIGREGEEGSRHRQRRLMRLQIGFRGRSYWSSPFQLQFPAGDLVGGKQSILPYDRCRRVV
jgi:hypothetical protein